MQPPHVLHLFGEMDLDVNLGAGSVYGIACEIAENCGYVASTGKGCILIYGEDSDDSVTVVNKLHHLFGRIEKVEKLVYKNDKLIRTIPVWQRNDAAQPEKGRGKA